MKSILLSALNLIGYEWVKWSSEETEYSSAYYQAEQVIGRLS